MSIGHWPISRVKYQRQMVSATTIQAAYRLKLGWSPSLITKAHLYLLFSPETPGQSVGTNSDAICFLGKKIMLWWYFLTSPVGNSIWKGTIHLRRWQSFMIFDPYPPTIGIPAKCLWGKFFILMSCDLWTIGTWGYPLRHADVLNGWSQSRWHQNFYITSYSEPFLY